jgi:hypothetical protein
MSEVLARFYVPGHPRTKGSLNAWCRRDKAHTVRVEEDIEDSKLWRKTVARVSRRYQMQRYGRLLKHEGPVEVWLAFFFEREMSVVKGVRTDVPIPTHQTGRPTHITLGDGDKLKRNVLDALSAPSEKSKRHHLPYLSALYLDDSQVSDWHGGKFWADEISPPGVRILVTEAQLPEAALALADAAWVHSVPADGVSWRS